MIDLMPQHPAGPKISVEQLLVHALMRLPDNCMSINSLGGDLTPPVGQILLGFDPHKMQFLVKFVPDQEQTPEKDAKSV